MSSAGTHYFFVSPQLSFAYFFIPFYKPWALICFIDKMMENIIVLNRRMSISIITNIFIQVVRFLNENFCENVCRIQSVGSHLVLRLQITDRCQFNVITITYLFAQLMSKIHLPKNGIHENKYQYRKRCGLSIHFEWQS